LPLIFGQLPARGQARRATQPQAASQTGTNTGRSVAAAAGATLPLPDPAPAARVAWQPPQDQEDQLPPDPQQPPIVPPPPGQEVTEDLPTAALSSVRLEYVPGLGGFIIVGPRQEVEAVQRLIETIKQISQTTQPVVEVHFLQNANSEAVGELLNQVYEAILLPRQGEVSITPLVKPNALLLIGSPENLVVVKEMIDKLDTEVPYPMQFEVFLLEHIAAADAAEVITTSFQEPTGLSTRVRVTSVYRNNSLIVQASPRDMEEVRRLLEKLDVLDAPATSEVRIFQLNNALADDLAPVLQDAINWQLTSQGAPRFGQQGVGQAGVGVGQGLTQERARLRSNVLQLFEVDGETKRLIKSGILSNVRVTSDAASNSLVVTAPPESMELIGTLIRQLDNLPTASAQVKVFTIQNGDATRLATMLQTMFGQTTTGQAGGFGGAGQLGGLRQLGVQTAAGAGESSLAPLNFGVDERSNSIIVSGSPSDLTVIEAILIRLDEKDLVKRKSVVYRLSNVPAQFVADSLTLLLNNQRTILQQRVQQFGLQSAFEQVDSEVFVVPEIISNSLIISATPRYFNEIMQVVSDLDRRPPLIKIDILIAEIQLTDNEELGVELGLQDSLLFDRSVANGTLSPGFLFNNFQLGNANSPASLATRGQLAGQALSSFNVGRSSSTLGYGGLVLSAANESISILIRALQDSGRIQVLSRPQISTMDSQPASILVGERVPRIADTTLTNQGTTNTVVLDEVGLVLGVTPRVTADNIVVMEIDVEQSTVGPISDGIPISINANGDVINSPRYDVRNASTTVSARNGQTIAFAGLIQNRRAIDERKVPYIGDIPIVGHLFRFDSHVEERRELLIIMTPHIVATQEDVDWINYTETERMSWCLSDVMEITRDSHLFGSDGAFGDKQAPVIFPDDDPAGTSVPSSPETAPKTMPAGPTLGSPPQPLPSGADSGSSRRNTAQGQPSEAAFWRPPAPIPPAQREAQLISGYIPQDPSMQPVQFQQPLPPAAGPGFSESPNNEPRLMPDSGYGHAAPTTSTFDYP
jgi:type II secretion system protein D